MDLKHMRAFVAVAERLSFLEGALATLHSADIALKTVRGRAPTHTGSVSIGFTDDFLAYTRLIDVLARFHVHAECPNVLANCCVKISYNLVRMLQAQQLDIALLCFPLPMPGPEFELRELPPIPIVVDVPRDLRLLTAFEGRDPREERVSERRRHARRPEPLQMRT